MVDGVTPTRDDAEFIPFEAVGEDMTMTMTMTMTMVDTTVVPDEAGNRVDDATMTFDTATSTATSTATTTPTPTPASSGSSTIFSFHIISTGLDLIPWDLLTLEHVIGQGARSQVHAGYMYGAPVAIKIMSSLSKRMMDAFVKEIEILHRVRHPNIVSVYGYVRPASSCVGIVTELMSGGDLHTRVHKHGGHPLRVQDALSLLVDVGHALCFLHAKGMPHRDIKPSNVVLNARGDQAKLADFGLSADVQEVLHLEGAGTERYAAPEVLLGGVADMDSDVFSFGVMAYEVLSGRRPFANAPSGNVRGNVFHPPGEPTDFPGGVEGEIVDIIFECFGDTGSRPSMFDLVRVLSQP